MSIFSTLDYLEEMGAKDGLERGRLEGACRQLGKLLTRHGKRLFGPPPDAASALLARLVDGADRPQLEAIRDRLPTAQGWPDLLAGVAEPGPSPPDPEYLLPFEFDPEPMTPAIDEFAKVSMLGQPAIIHLRFQKLYQENIGAILYAESRRLRAEHSCPVEHMVLLLWPGADGPAMSGEYQIPTGGVHRFQVTRLWEKDAEEMFNSIATVAFAPLGRFPPERLPEILRRMEEVIETKSRHDKDRTNVWFMAYSSMGLVYPAEQVNRLLAHKLDFLYKTPQCRRTLSDGYYAGQSKGQEEGQLQGTRDWILALGRRRLGEPPDAVPPALASVRSLDRLEQLASRVLKGASWPEVLAPG